VSKEDPRCWPFGVLTRAAGEESTYVYSDPAKCEPCRIPGHDTCGMVHGCPCCADVLEAADDA